MYGRLCDPGPPVLWQSTHAELWGTCVSWTFLAQPCIRWHVPQTPDVAGVWPLASYRNASFLQNEVPGVEVPQAVMDRMSSAGGREEQLAVGVEIARESVALIRTRIAGIQVSAPFGKIATALAVLEE